MYHIIVAKSYYFWSANKNTIKKHYDETYYIVYKNIAYILGQEAECNKLVSDFSNIREMIKETLLKFSNPNYEKELIEHTRKIKEDVRLQKIQDEEKRLEKAMFERNELLKDFDNIIKAGTKKVDPVTIILFIRENNIILPIRTIGSMRKAWFEFTLDVKDEKITVISGRYSAKRKTKCPSFGYQLQEAFNKYQIKAK